MKDKTKNAGVDAQIGFALQRNSALFLLLDKYHTKFHGKQYFICLEHQDDFLFCFLNENDEAELIEAFQSKKKAPDIWRANSELYEIIGKLLKTGKNLIVDEIPQSSNYKHILYFSTNQTIKLEHKSKIENGETKNVTESIKADNENVRFLDLPQEIQEKLKKGIADTELHNELENLSLLWIPFTQSVKEQENQLVGKIEEVFGENIHSHRSAVKTLITIFNDIEYIYNQGNEIKLLDERNRVDANAIENAITILTTKSKCFNYWHSEKENIVDALQIKQKDRCIFEFAFSSAFDMFKVFENAEHRKILQFTKDNIDNCKKFKNLDIVLELLELFNKKTNSHLLPLELKAIFFAAFFEATFKTENS
jgi:hypothetical protein